MAGRKKTSQNTLPLFAENNVKPRPRVARIRKGDHSDAPVSSEYVTTNGERLKQWASRGIYFGTSSWKYPGWKGQVYNRSYPSKRSFDQECLTEYAQLFPTVCADFALYDFPNPEKMHVFHEQTPDTFTVSLKVTDRITIRRYPNLPRHGANAGKENPDFLNVRLFEQAFLEPLEQLKKKRGVIIFEFSTFYPSSGVAYDGFMELIDGFLSHLPRGYDYAIELRNRDFLTEEYLTMLSSHGVAHLLNNWTRMPPIIDQIKLAGILTANFSVARALLKPGRTYQQAVDLFQPYDAIKEENAELRTGLAESVQRCIADGKSLYAYVNNRAEGNSPRTIEAILDILNAYPVEKL
ncbi:MAG: DUF72 domain-containing protein [Bacteroidetes bacterium]|nr:DUF72 domain-containing protein [Bacteroidota bacterium]